MTEKHSLRIDDTGFGDVRILQDPETFCYGVDAVLLAGFAAERLKGRSRPSRLCDLGTGNGIVPLILSHKTPIGDMWGIEVQEEIWRLAVKNAELTNWREGCIFCTPMFAIFGRSLSNAGVPAGSRKRRAGWNTPNIRCPKNSLNPSYSRTSWQSWEDREVLMQ